MWELVIQAAALKLVFSAILVWEGATVTELAMLTMIVVQTFV